MALIQKTLFGENLDRYNTFDNNRLRLGEYHPNINGYRKMADIIYEKIKNKL